MFTTTPCRCDGPCCDRHGPQARFGEAPAPAAPCGSKYLHLVRNGQGGDLDQPCANSWLGAEFYCNQEDVRLWGQQVAYIDTLIRTGLARLRATNPAAEVNVAAAVARWRMQTLLISQGSFWNLQDNLAAATKLAKICADGACTLELLDNALGAPAVDVAVQPSGPPSPLDVIFNPIGNLFQGLAPWVLVGVVAYLAIRSRGSSRART